MKTYTYYSVTMFLVEELILAFILSWFLPSFDINIPLWLVLILMEAWAAYSYLTSNLVTRVINKQVSVGREALIGVKGTTTTPLCPDGYARVGAELWRARSMSGDIDPGEEVLIVRVDRLTLLVKPSMADNWGKNFSSCRS
jgi:membrane-bound ClpP family serine protease